MGSSTAVIGPEPVAVVLAAGEGRRLRPISEVRPKALCPVGGVPLIDLAIERVAPVVGAVAVNVHHGRDVLEAHLRGRDDVHVSIEEEVALGTAGGVARLRGWIDGRPVVVVNADAWSPAPVPDLTTGWDGSTVRVLVRGDDELRDDSLVGACLLPWSVVTTLDERPSGLFESVWRDARAAGRLDVVRHDGELVDCGTPARYLDANRRAVALAGGSIVLPGARVADGVRVEGSVIGAGARIAADVVDSVVWDGQSVASDSPLTRSILVGPSTAVVVDEPRARTDARN